MVLLRIFALAFVALWLAACGSGAPHAREAAGPGVALEAPDNPAGLEPLRGAPRRSRALWPRVRGHLPYGFNAAAPGVTAEQFARLHAGIGASLARTGADWAQIRRRPDRWDYSGLDASYRAYVAAGVRPLIVFSRRPARLAGDGRCQGAACWGPPKDLSLTGDWAADLARRYPLAGGIEVWNEPNLRLFWGERDPDPEAYAELLAEVHDAVKAVAPAMPVLGGAIAHADDGAPGRMATEEFVRRMLEAGAADHMDALSYHEYPNADGAEAAIARAYDAAGVPMRERLVVTEFGASTTDGFDAAGQRDWLLQRYAEYDRSELPIDAAIIHAPTEDPQAADWQMGFGLTTRAAGSGFAPKPAYCAFRQRYGGRRSCPPRI